MREGNKAAKGLREEWIELGQGKWRRIGRKRSEATNRESEASEMEGGLKGGNQYGEF